MKNLRQVYAHMSTFLIRFPLHHVSSFFAHFASNFQKYNKDSCKTHISISQTALNYIAPIVTRTKLLKSISNNLQTTRLFKNQSSSRLGGQNERNNFLAKFSSPKKSTKMRRKKSQIWKGSCRDESLSPQKVVWVIAIFFSRPSKSRGGFAFFWEIVYFEGNNNCYVTCQPFQSVRDWS